MPSGDIRRHEFAPQSFFVVVYERLLDLGHPPLDNLPFLLRQLVLCFLPQIRGHFLLMFRFALVPRIPVEERLPIVPFSDYAGLLLKFIFADSDMIVMTVKPTEIVDTQNGKTMRQVVLRHGRRAVKAWNNDFFLGLCCPTSMGFRSSTNGRNPFTLRVE